MTSPYRHIALGAVGSTNDEASARLRAGDPGGFIVTAREQHGGRGRQGRLWISAPGNLYMSLALRDPGPSELIPQLGFVAGVALAGTLRFLLNDDDRVRLKWPNDILHGDAKMAGMLLEGSSLPSGGIGCVVGIGVNCTSHPRGLGYPATDLATAGASAGDPSEVLAEFARRFDMALTIWDRGRGFPAVRRDWLASAAGLGERISVATPRHRLDGIFRGLDATGRLMLDSADGTVAIEAGDVFFPALAAMPA